MTQHFPPIPRVETAIRPIREIDKTRPEGCVCDPREWSLEISPVCNHYEPEPGKADRCGWCEHDLACHQQELPDDDFAA